MAAKKKCKTVRFKAKRKVVTFVACFTGTKKSRSKKRSTRAKKQCRKKSGAFKKCR
jgi:hypothetical protein